MGDKEPVPLSPGRRVAPPVARGRLVTLEVNVTIRQEARTIFAFLADQRNRRLILPADWTDFRVITPYSRGVGARALFILRLPWRNAPVTVEMLALEEPVRLVERAVGAQMAFDILWSLEPVGGGMTRVTLRSSYVPAGGVLGLLLDRLVTRRLLRRDYRQELVRLKREVE